MHNIPSVLTIGGLTTAYRIGKLSPVEVIAAAFARSRRETQTEIWITLADEDAACRRAHELAARLHRDPATALVNQPLLGVPFAVKDNIDVDGLPTTAACPAFSHVPTVSAEVVELLENAGAILIGKTNLDQFATGLVGTRSPHGAVRNPFHPAYISGGSSSGSAAAVALGFVAFSLGTDTAGSGRVPAGFCNLIGIKPTPGLVSTRGVVPACRSLDCVSIFAHTVGDGWQVLSALAGIDAGDPYSRRITALGPLTRKLRIAVPDRLEFFADDHAEEAFSSALSLLREDPRVTVETFPFAPFQEVASLLYDGPWVAERRVALGAFFDAHADDMDPVVRSVISRADGKNAQDAFLGAYRLEAGKRLAERLFADIDLMLVPTAPTHYTISEIDEAPVDRNSRLGTYTNFVNLLGMSALALPGPFRADGLPAGVTLIGPGGADHRLAEFARSVEPLLHRRLGLTEAEPARSEALSPLPADEPILSLAVVGAHLSAQPLNWQLLERGAWLVRKTRTAATYRLFALPGTVPAKPGMVKVATGGAAIEVEVWHLPARNYGSFVADIPSPLAIGSLDLEDGSQVQGFLCEAWAIEGTEDITRFGGWRAYRALASSTSMN